MCQIFVKFPDGDMPCAARYKINVLSVVIVAARALVGPRRLSTGTNTLDNRRRIFVTSGFADMLPARQEETIFIAVFECYRKKMKLLIGSGFVLAVATAHGGT